MQSAVENPSLIDRITAGDPRAVARAISKVEDLSEDASQLMKDIFPHTGRSLIIGITGSPGAGKSSLVDKLALFYRGRGERIGIVAVDPSSPFSGGAILGDRIRMQALGLDKGVFIRSMATRGNLGGLARATVDVVSILDAAGYSRIMVETVGVGQDEVEIVKAADVSVVVLVPGMGDDIQAIKAGIMEIGDVFVINKADREGVYDTEKELHALLSLSTRDDGWEPPIIKTVAIENSGIEELASAIESYRKSHEDRASGTERRRAIARWRILELLRERLVSRTLASDSASERLDRLAEEVASRQRDPYSAVDELLEATLNPISFGLRIPGTNKFVEIDTSSLMEADSASMRIDHIGIATEGLQKAQTFWQEFLGLNTVFSEEIASQKVRVAMLPVGDSRIELLEATSEDSPVARFLSKRGPGIHHIAIRVSDIRTKLERLKEQGVRLIDETPRIGAGGCLVAFIHPSSTNGVLLELVQHQ
jgi:LAO/AO transport system kinase